MDRLHYLDFDIRIAPEGAKYRTGIVRSTSGEASLTFSLPFTRNRLDLPINKPDCMYANGPRRRAKR